MMLEYPFVIYRGDTYRRTFRLWSDQAKTVPVDLTGVTVAAEIRNRPGGSMMAQLLCTVTTNQVTVEVSAAVSRLIQTAGVWDLQLTYPSNEVRTVVYGPVRVDADVTASTFSVPPPV